MRTKSSVKNLIVSLSLGALSTIFLYVTQAIFIKQLGVEYLGINGLFTNIISMLAIAELGIGPAIIYHLYGPLAAKDNVRIAALMNFYKIAYRYIAIIVFVIGLALVPFLPLLTSSSRVSVNIYAVFTLFVANAVVSYLMSYKRSVLYADQKNYIINIVHMGSIVALNVTQIILLISTHNYYLYLILKIVSTLIENIILNHIATKRYLFLSDKPEVLDIETRRSVIRKVKGLIFHSLGAFVVLGTDNILLSIFFGVVVVGLYSNYILIVTTINSLLSQALTAITASIGNLLLDKNPSRNEKIFKKIYFANFWISTVVVVIFLNAVNPFINIWVGQGYNFSPLVVGAITFSLYLTLLRKPIESFKVAAGIFYVDRFMPVTESIINLVLSLVLLHTLGVIGVFIGTICSTLFLHFYSFPKYTYVPLFQKRWKGYWSLILQSIIITVTVAAISYYIVGLVPSNNVPIKLFGGIAISLIISNSLLFVVYARTSEFLYFKELVKNMAKRAFSIVAKRKT